MIICLRLQPRISVVEGCSYSSDVFCLFYVFTVLRTPLEHSSTWIRPVLSKIYRNQTQGIGLPAKSERKMFRSIIIFKESWNQKRLNNNYINHINHGTIAPIKWTDRPNHLMVAIFVDDYRVLICWFKMTWYIITCKCSIEQFTW